MEGNITFFLFRFIPLAPLKMSNLARTSADGPT